MGRLLLNMTRGKVLVNALLPRGDGFEKLPSICPPRCHSNGQPFRSFMPAIKKVNKMIADSISALEAGGRVAFVNCGRAFYGMGGNVSSEVRLDLMPDRLHPNAAGMRLLALCFSAALDKLA